MACNYPMHRIDTEKHRAWAITHDVFHRSKNGGVIINRTEYNYFKSIDKHFDDIVQEIPCGKCIACRLEYSRQWAMRCVNEAKCHLNNYFVTLTYSNEHLHYAPFYNVETGEIENKMALFPEDLKKFMKDLRRYFDYHFSHQGIRFFACGEFGELYFRPHFHVILFNCPFDDVKEWFKRTVNGRTIITSRSKTLDKIWHKGICTISDVTYESCAYVARYCLKKAFGKSKREQVLAQRFMLLEDGSEFIFSNEKQACDWVYEFTRSSRRPGIGREYYELNKYDMYKTDEMFIPSADGLMSVKPCKYYDKLFDVEFPEQMQVIKEKRILIGRKKQIERLSKTDLTDEEIRVRNEQRLKNSVKKLTRDKTET